MSNITEKQIDKLVEEKLSKLIAGNPTDFALAMLVKMGEMCIEANATTMDVKTESTLDGKRYVVKAKISIKELKK